MNIKTPITLTSPAPLDDGGRKYNTIYIIFAILGVIFSIFSGNGSLFILGAIIGLLFGWVIKTMILSYKGPNLRNLKFQLEYPVSKQYLVHELISTLTPLNITVEIDTEGLPIITHKRKIYDVIFNDDQTFQLWWRKPFLSALMGWEGEISRYRKLVVDMGIIAYHIQNIAHKEKIQNEINNSSTQQSAENSTEDFIMTPTLETNSNTSTQDYKNLETQYIFCTRCGTKLKNTDKFCTNCGNKL